MSEEREFKVDELAHDAGLPVSTVRMYQHRGLIDPPEKRGRVGYYNEGHRDRLTLIARLQDRGFSLAGIKQAIDSWNTGESLDELLDVGDIAPTLERKELRLNLAELAERFSGVELTQPDIQRAVEVGAVRIDGTEVIVANPPFATIGPAVAKAGIPISVMLDEYAAIREPIEHIADRFRRVFEEQLWDTFVEDGMPLDRIPELTEAASTLMQLATASVSAELNDRFAEFVGEYVETAKAGSADRS